MYINSKPSWYGAPSWAKYLAMQPDGRWIWFEEKPTMLNGEWLAQAGSKSELAVEWINSLEDRPGRYDDRDE